jgi:hypothetical protein
VQPNLWEGENIGGHRELYKERQTAGDYYEFRTLEQLETDDSEAEGSLTPVPVLKPKPEEGEEDTIKVRFISKRPTESDSEGGEAQIKVEETKGGDGIIVKGNGVNIQPDGNSFMTNLSVSDGLVKSAGTQAFGLTTTVSIIDGCGTQVHVLNFTVGLLTGYEIQAVSA